MRYILSTLILLCFIFPVRASHIVGVDLYYSWLTGSDYKVTCNLYGDCGSQAVSTSYGTLPAATPNICVYDGDTYVTTFSLAIVAPDSGLEITPVCPDSVGHTQCTSLTIATPGIKRFVYTGSYTVPYPSHYWRFVYTGYNGATASSAGRAAAITNVSVSASIQLVDTLDNIVGNNSNPVLTVVPTPFFCLNNSDGYSPGAVDAEHDSLDFALVDGMNGSGGSGCVLGGPVSYIPPFTGAAPLSCVPGSFSFDTHTGQIVFQPNIIQRALVVYNVREFRGGTFIGSCQREMTFLVQTCTRIPPTGNFGSSTLGQIDDGTHFEICSETDSFNLTIDPSEVDTFNNITITASGLPLHSHLLITDNGTPKVKAFFSWNTIGLPPGDYPFFLTYTDNGCPLPGTQTVTYVLRILPPLTVTVTPAVSTINYGSSVQLTAWNHSPFSLLYWWVPSDGTLSNPNINNPIATPLTTTKYYVDFKNAIGCKGRDSALVIVDSTAHELVPTSFTPNGDSKNDVFRIVNMKFERLIDFSVYNRWGKLVFQTADKTKGWDGIYNNQPAESGVYYYHIIFEKTDGAIKDLSGDVTLIR